MNTLSTCPLPCPLFCHLHFTCLPFQLLFPHLVTSLQVNKQLLHMMLPALNSSYTFRSPDPSLLSTPLPTLLLLFPFLFSTYSSLHQPPLPPYPFPPQKKYIVYCTLNLQNLSPSYHLSPFPLLNSFPSPLPLSPIHVILPPPNHPLAFHDSLSKPPQPPNRPPTYIHPHTCFNRDDVIMNCSELFCME